MSNVLRVRTEPGGEWTEIPSIQGPQGEDGFSPVVTTTPIDGGTKVTITDAAGDHSFDVMNGAGGNTNPTWVAYSPEEYVLDGVNDTYAMWLDNSRFSTPAAVGSYGMVIAKGQAGADGTEAKSWIFVGEVLSPNSPIEGKTFVQVKFPLEIGSGNAANELITIKDTKVTNISQLPEEPCCIHAIDSEIGFAFKDDIIYVRPLGSLVEIYTIDGSIATVNVDPDTGAFTTGGPVENWAKESEVYNKEQVDEKIAAAAPDLSAYALKTEIPDVSQFKTGTEIQTMIDDAIAAITDFTEVSF